MPDRRGSGLGRPLSGLPQVAPASTRAHGARWRGDPPKAPGIRSACRVTTKQGRNRVEFAKRTQSLSRRLAPVGARRRRLHRAAGWTRPECRAATPPKSAHARTQARKRRLIRKRRPAHEWCRYYDTGKSTSQAVASTMTVRSRPGRQAGTALIHFKIVRTVHFPYRRKIRLLTNKRARRLLVPS
jgi:hypothetical protein